MNTIKAFLKSLADGLTQLETDGALQSVLMRGDEGWSSATRWKHYPTAGASFPAGFLPASPTPM